MPMGKGTYGKRVGRPATNSTRKRKAVMAKSSGKLETYPASHTAYMAAQQAADAAENKKAAAALQASKKNVFDSVAKKPTVTKARVAPSASKTINSKKTTTAKKITTARKRPTTRGRKM